MDSDVSMDFLPLLAKKVHMSSNDPHDLPKLTCLESIVFPQFRRPRRTTQIYDRFASTRAYMHMRRQVILRVDHDRITVHEQDRRHSDYYKPKRLGFEDYSFGVNVGTIFTGA